MSDPKTLSEEIQRIMAMPLPETPTHFAGIGAEAEPAADQKSEVREPTTMEEILALKACASCRYREVGFGVSDPNFWRCISPRNTDGIKKEIDPVTGKFKVLYDYCRQVRNISFLGCNGDWWAESYYLRGGYSRHLLVDSEPGTTSTTSTPAMLKKLKNITAADL